MRAMYLQEACHHNCKLSDQIRKLNGKVLDYVIPNIITNVKQYVHYIKDISKSLFQLRIDLLMLIVKPITKKRT